MGALGKSQQAVQLNEKIAKAREFLASIMPNHTPSRDGPYGGAMAQIVEVLVGSHFQGPMEILQALRVGDAGKGDFFDKAKALKHFGKAINQIDDVLDGSSVEQLRQMVAEGYEYSLPRHLFTEKDGQFFFLDESVSVRLHPLLCHPQVCSPEAWDALSEVVHQGILRADDLIRAGNLFCEEVEKLVELRALHHAEPSPQTWREVADQNRHITGISIALIPYVFKHDRNGPPLTPERLLTDYASSVAFGRCMQIYDDLEDLFKDYSATGSIPPDNFIAACLSRSSAAVTNLEERLAEIGPAIIYLRDMEGVLGNAIEEAVACYRQEAAALPPIMKRVCMWLMEGLLDHPIIVNVPVELEKGDWRHLPRMEEGLCYCDVTHCDEERALQLVSVLRTFAAALNVNEANIVYQKQGGACRDRDEMIVCPASLLKKLEIESQPFTTLSFREKVQFYSGLPDVDSAFMSSVMEEIHGMGSRERTKPPHE